MKSGLQLVLVVILFFHVSCKHSHDVDPVLLEADILMHEGMALGIIADSILDARMAQGANEWNLDTLRKLKSEVANWKAEMIGVPGVGHDHHHHENDGHHHDHDHNHNHDHELGAQLTPAEIKKVQQDWKSRIEVILLKLL